MTDQIERCAESIRRELAQIGEINILRMAEQLGERSLVVYQALGWLARQGGVRYLTRGNQTYVSLPEGSPYGNRASPGSMEGVP